MKRLFFALWPDEITRQQITQLIGRLGDDNLKKVRPENLHVTLSFLGNVDSETEQQLKERAARIDASPFTISFTQLHFWRKPKILCLLSQDPPPSPMLSLVHQLTEIVEMCGLKTEDRPYKPHITLARKARRACSLQFKPIVWSAENFCLVESTSTVNGVSYQVLQTWKLGSH